MKVKLIAVLVLVMSVSSFVRAEIYNWQTGEIIVGTENITPSPNVCIMFHNTITNNLRYADLADKDLRSSNFYGSWFDNAHFINSNLTNAVFKNSVLFGADFTDAEVQGADFDSTVANGFTSSQLYSTKSYKDKDLTRINLENNDLRGWNFANQNLTNACFDNTEVKGADFTNSIGFTKYELSQTKSFLYLKDLSGIGLGSLNLTGFNFSKQNMANASLSNSNLTNALFENSMLFGADFSDAEVQGAHFDLSVAKGFTSNQLYSTKSYKDKNLTGIWFQRNDLRGWNFANQNLTNARFDYADVKGADFTNSIGFTSNQLRSTNSFAYFKDLSGIGLGSLNLTGFDFSQQNMANASLSNSNLTRARFSDSILFGVDFTDAEVQGAHFDLSVAKGFTSNQLYSTKSYKDKNLTGIWFQRNDLRGWNFANQNLTYAQFYDSTLNGSDFSGADLRGAFLWGGLSAGAIVRNTIESDGKISSLNLIDGDMLFIRNNPMAISIFSQMNVNDGGVLRFVFDGQAWTSTVNMMSDIPVDLGGTIDLAFADGVDISSLIGTSFNLFDWNGRLQVGDTFNNIIFAEGTDFDLSNLYTTGEVTLIPEPTTVAFLTIGLLALRKRKS